jgi:O-acetyl-ADP-ribose deacetylase (regulator of RNase III)
MQVPAQMNKGTTITFTKGDIFTAQVEALVNPVNCVGVMGKGLAAQFKANYPENFTAYALACKFKEVVPGRMFCFETGKDNPKWIINFPTKRHWKDVSHVEDILFGLGSLAKEIENKKIKSIAIPALGCGLGGLKWANVRPLIEQKLEKLCKDVQIIVFEP